MKYLFNDGGRRAAGFGGPARDCVARAVAIATGLPYQHIHARIAAGNADQRRTKRTSPRVMQETADDGVLTTRKWFKDWLESMGWRFTATMSIGSGCQVHLKDGELPMGALIVKVSRHYVAVIDGVIYDTHDCSRGGTRCVYGYWKKEEA